MTTDVGFSVSGFKVGHWTHASGATGCSVVLVGERALAVADVRGGAPGTRELALLDQGRLVQRVDAVLLTGGSAFGLSAAEGVMRWLRERGRGFSTSSIPVPIVPAMVLFDLKGENPVWPGADDGYSAADTATEHGWRNGRIGAGAGATINKLYGNQLARPGGLGASFVDTPLGRVAALVAVNAVGDVFAQDGAHEVWTMPESLENPHDGPAPGENTTIGVVVFDGTSDRDTLVRCAQAAHDAFARTIYPAHTLFDGDSIVVMARREGSVAPRSTLTLTMAVEKAVSNAIVNAVRFSP